ncbi:TPR repeat-containing protein [Methylocella silvestris BL2]|uniref:TPR repeat-containing protein n=1 Tax=Methylocella silvestris (strain DSM 15510 / CIP 108128 / LMG 27833 / NCIMB 13906 / BL2) TaxID=395965 RepID=B8EID4_METSB|nr:DUF6165 family protein [Methylocella silvestris]ACK51253.1 TPR repeat-containing protein [Methylocella silvestris BL2]
MSVPKYESAAVSGQGHSRDKALLQVAITRAFAFLNSGQPDEALAELGGHAQRAARSDLACYVFGLICFNAGDLREALIWFERALALKPDYFEVLSARAIVLQRLGQPEDALEAFEDILKLRPNDADALFSIGVILQSLGRMNEALVSYEGALRAQPKHCEALTNRGALLERFGRLTEALSCFEAIIALRPNNGGALFNKGSVLQKLGRNEDALAAYEAAAQSGPPDPETELNRGNVLQKLGRLDEAIVCYDRAARRPGGYPQALYNKGIALQALGRRSAALAAYDAALVLDPRYCEAICNRGNLLHELGRLEDAYMAYAAALKIRPAFLPALTNRANICLQWGRLDEAIRHCDEALRHDPKYPQALGLRGAALHRLGRLEEALVSLDLAVSVRPAAPEAWLNRGNVLQEMDRLADAVASYHEALRLSPHYPEALSSLGVALKEQGDVDEALACFNEAIHYKPDYPDARNNRAGALLLMGRLKEGFRDFESRWDRSNAPPRPIIPAAARWTGEDLTGKKILVYDEQGLGDLIQFCRYIPLLEERGAEVTLLCRRTMQRLLRSLDSRVRMIDSLDPQDRYDFASALLSLPGGFGAELETIPAQTPYLFAEPQAVAQWSQRIGPEGFRIGICWRGNSAINLKRGFSLDCLGPIAAIEGARLIGLVKGEGPMEIETPQGSARIEGPGPDYDAGPDAFIDCAAVMESLDLVITSDTAIAHLAGALGRPVFVALKHAPDWRWLLHRLDSPWYPTMRLFRQKERDQWRPVFDEMAAAVGALVRGVGNSIPPPDLSSSDQSVAAGPHALQPEDPPALIAIPAGVGELIDKITILEIKERRVDDPAKLHNIRFELALLRKLRDEHDLSDPALARLEAELRKANESLWDVEDALRSCESKNKFDEEFVSLARLVYTCNDKRAHVKKEINLLFNSAIIEEKSYARA